MFHLSAEIDFLLDVKIEQVRSYFPESWLWEEHETERWEHYGINIKILTCKMDLNFTLRFKLESNTL